MVNDLWTRVTDPDRTFIIAEAGVNHNGDIGLARQLVDAAVSAGADAVKFQTFKAESVATAQAPKAQYQETTTDGQESQLEMLRRLELSAEAHHELFAYCRNKGVEFLSTAFDEESLDFLNGLRVPFFKIPSGEITNYALLRRTARTGKPVILSTGMSSLEEIESAVGILRKEGTQNIALLHCVTSYPARARDVNLRAMQAMTKAFGLPVGYSDHTTGLDVALAAVARGAVILEKHFTLDCSLPGPDHKASLEPGELTDLVKGVRRVEEALGKETKAPAEVELVNRQAIRRSLVARQLIKKGEPFTENNVAAKRPGTGINPMRWPEVIGQTAKRNFEPDEELEL